MIKASIAFLAAFAAAHFDFNISPIDYIFLAAFAAAHCDRFWTFDFIYFLAAFAAAHKKEISA